ncbi:MAG: enoyl-CoA hydratase/isomerase family protein [Desulfatibacillum sp.]|nr:enoyl-CoA hydratase/isomerase family protein [Desulfatibacillum sp.]
MESDFFKVERIGGVARCSMNNPKNMNAMGADLIFPMLETIPRLMADDSVKVIVLRGEGGNFSTGGDANMLGENLDPVILSEAMVKVNDILLMLSQGPKPVITEVDGFAVGGGMGLALASDITYATERAVFSVFFIQIAAVPDLGCAYFLTERVGMAKARELVFTGKMFNAEKALDMGLINKVSPHESISEEVMELATKIASRSAKALAWTKRAMSTVSRVDLRTALDLEAHLQPLLLMSQDHKEAIKAFLERMPKT